jgi:3-hydroxyacyl-[acyl-carrier-protein] dehydratase
LSEFTHQYSIASTHPSLAGHFPNNPIVPGVVILDYVRNLLQQWLPMYRIKTLSQVKFLKPLHPEQSFTIRLIQASPSLIKFECDSAEEKLVVGTFIIERTHE